MGSRGGWFKTRSQRVIRLNCLIFLGCFWLWPAEAQDASLNQQVKKINGQLKDQEKKLADQERALKAQQAAIAKQEAIVEAQRNQITQLRAQSEKPQSGLLQIDASSPAPQPTRIAQASPASPAPSSEIVSPFPTRRGGSKGRPTTPGHSKPTPGHCRAHTCRAFHFDAID